MHKVQGIYSRENANLNLWFREIAPSNDLQKKFSHEVEEFESFREDYLKELIDNPEFHRLLEICRDNEVVLLYSATDTERNNAVVLKEALEQGMGESPH